MSNLVQKYLNRDDLLEIEKLENNIKNNEINITCIGLYNHGKSSLLNALIDDYDMKTFKTADARETSENKYVKVGDITYIDTPGLNAREEDDKKIYDALITSDINLFVHNVTTGEFTQSEIDFLNHIKNSWHDPDKFIDNTIFVISRIDGANSKDDIDNTIKKMKEQLREIFGKDGEFIPVSALRYAKGKKDGKNVLIKKSNIDSLKSLISNKKENMKEAILEAKKRKLQKKYSEILNRLKEEREKKRKELVKFKKEDARFKEDIEEMEDKIKRLYRELRNI
jgi:tRNA U34 5-carboxymethylaminomethyl modifying GTPase MnmE/TrmE